MGLRWCFSYIIQPALLAIVFVSPQIACAQALPSMPPASSSLGVRTQGIFSTAPVTVDGVQLFRIAALANPPAGAMPIDTRLLLVQNAIGQVLAVDSDKGTTLFDPANLSIEIEREGSEFALVATDKQHATPVPIVTITAEDAQLAGVTQSDLAQQWRALLQPALSAALERRQPAQIRANLDLVVRGAIALGVVTLAGIGAFFLLRRRVALVTELIVVIVALAWFAGAVLTLLMFPQTTATANFIIHAAGNVATIWISAIIIELLLAVLIDRITNFFAHRAAPGVERARRMLRGPTISRAINGFKRFIVYFVALLATLSALSIPIASVVTIGGIAALAIGFAAQSLVRDCMNGMLVLFEDQYVVGDYVMIGNYNGIVEALSLRMVQIRDSLGNLITIPHSTVAQVANASRTWARIDYRVAVDPKADLTKALGVMKNTINALASDEKWASSFVEPIESIGVETINKLGIVLRVQVRTAPLRQFELRRALNARLMEAFAKEEIELGIDPLGLPAINPGLSPDPA